MKYNLNPDFRKDPPKNRPFCVRCQKEIKNISKAVHVLVEWPQWKVREVLGSTELMGRDCWKTITDDKENN